MVEIIWSWKPGKSNPSHLWDGRYEKFLRVTLCGVKVPQTGDDFGASTVECKRCLKIVEANGSEIPEIWRDQSVNRKGDH